MITLYDIASSLPDQTWSPNVWKARLTLAYKRLPFKIVYLEFPDIKPMLQSIGAEPAGVVPPRSAERAYSTPVIQDSKTGKVVSDSYRIAEYLDSEYPDTPQVIQPGTRGLLSAFGDSMVANASPWENVRAFVVTQSWRILNEPSKDGYRSRHEEIAQIKMEEFMPKGEAAIAAEWKTFVEGFQWCVDVLDKEEGPFIMGEVLSWADILMAGRLLWVKQVYGTESKEYRDIFQDFGGGRLGGFLKAVEDRLA